MNDTSFRFWQAVLVFHSAAGSMRSIAATRWFRRVRHALAAAAAMLGLCATRSVRAVEPDGIAAPSSDPSRDLAPPLSTTALPLSTTAPPLSTTAPPFSTTAPQLSTTALPLSTTAPPLSAAALAVPRARPVAPVSRALIASDIRGYYGGETVAASVVLSLGLAATAAGAVLVTRESDFARGLGWPLLTVGALEAVGAVGYLLVVDSSRRQQEAALARDATAFRRDEGAHMHGTTSRFVVYRAVELGLTVAGAVVAGLGLATQHDAVTGAGAGVAGIALPFFVIDTLNQARAARYEDHVRRFDPLVAFGLGARGPVWSLQARF